MRVWLATAPAWVAYALQALIWGVWMDAAESAHPLATRALLVAAGTAAIFGVVLWFATRRSRQRNPDYTVGLSTESRRVVYRAVASGEPPADPMLREVAVVIVRDRLRREMDSRWTTRTFYLALLVAFALFAAVSSWHSWRADVATAALAISTVAVFRTPVSLARRLASLEARVAHSGDR